MGEDREAGLASVALRAPFARPARWSLRIVGCKVNLALPGTILNEANTRSGFDFLVRQYVRSGPEPHFWDLILVLGLFILSANLVLLGLIDVIGAAIKLIDAAMKKW